MAESFYYKHERWFLFAFIWLVQALGYFWLNLVANSRNSYTLPLAFDQQIPFLSIFLIPYLAMYVVESLPYFVIREVAYLRRITLAYLAVMLVTFAIFAFFPVRMLRPEIVPASFLDSAVLLLYRLDFPYNTFPSLHASLTFLAGLVIYRIHQTEGTIVLLLAGLISLSTLFIKQHYVLDVLGGIALALLIHKIVLRTAAPGSRPI